MNFWSNAAGPKKASATRNAGFCTKKLKLEAIVDAPVGIAVFCDMEPQGHEYVLGAQSMRETLAWSVACSVQNLWLYLTEQGYGMGWVSFLDASALGQM